MVKLKNVTGSTDFNEKPCSKKPFEEPEGMTDIDLHEIISCQGTADGKNIEGTTKSQKHNLPKLMFAIGTGFVIITCILLTLLLINDSISLPNSRKYNLGNANFHKSRTLNEEFVIDKNVNLKKYESTKQNNIFESLYGQYKAKQDFSSTHNTKIHNVDNKSRQNQQTQKFTKLNIATANDSNKKQNKIRTKRAKNDEPRDDKNYETTGSYLYRTTFENTVAVGSNEIENHLDAKETKNTNFGEDDNYENMPTSITRSFYDTTHENITAFVSAERKSHLNSKEGRNVDSKEYDDYETTAHESIVAFDNSANHLNPKEAGNANSESSDDYDNMPVLTFSFLHDAIHENTVPIDSIEIENNVSFKEARNDNSEEINTYRNISTSTSYFYGTTQQKTFENSEGENHLVSKEVRNNNSEESNDYGNMPTSTNSHFSSTTRDNTFVAGSSDSEKHLGAVEATNGNSEKISNYENIPTSTTSYLYGTARDNIFVSGSGDSEKHLGAVEARNGNSEESSNYENLPTSTTSYFYGTSDSEKHLAAVKARNGNSEESSNYENIPTSTTAYFYGNTRDNTFVSGSSDSDKYLGAIEARNGNSEEISNYENIPTSTISYFYGTTRANRFISGSSDSEKHLGVVEARNGNSEESSNYENIPTSTTSYFYGTARDNTFVSGSSDSEKYLSAVEDRNGDSEESSNYENIPTSTTSYFYGTTRDNRFVSGSSDSEKHLGAVEAGNGNSEESSNYENIPTSTTAYFYGTTRDNTFVSGSSGSEKHLGAVEARNGNSEDIRNYENIPTSTTSYFYGTIRDDTFASESSDSKNHLGAVEARNDNSEESSNYENIPTSTTSYFYGTTRDNTFVAGSSDSEKHLGAVEARNGNSEQISNYENIPTSTTSYFYGTIGENTFVSSDSENHLGAVEGRNGNSEEISNYENIPTSTTSYFYGTIRENTFVSSDNETHLGAVEARNGNSEESSNYEIIPTSTTSYFYDTIHENVVEFDSSENANYTNSKEARFGNSEKINDYGNIPASVNSYLYGAIHENAVEVDSSESDNHISSKEAKNTFVFDNRENHLDAVEARNSNSEESNDYETIPTSTTSSFYDTTHENVVAFDSGESENHLVPKEARNDNSEKSNTYGNMPTSTTSYFYRTTPKTTFVLDSTESKDHLYTVEARNGNSEESNDYEKMPTSTTSYFYDTKHKNAVAFESSENHISSKEAVNSFVFDDSENHFSAVEVGNGNSGDGNHYQNIPTSTTSPFYDSIHENVVAFDISESENHLVPKEARNDNSEESNTYGNMPTSTTSYFYGTAPENAVTFDSSESKNHLGTVEARNDNSEESDVYENMSSSTTSYFYDATHENAVAFDSSESENHSVSKEARNGNLEESNDYGNMPMSTTSYIYGTTPENKFVFDSSESKNHLGTVEARNGNSEESNDYENMSSSTTSYFYDTTHENAVSFDSSDSENHLFSKEARNDNSEESSDYEHMLTSTTTPQNTVAFDSSKNNLSSKEARNSITGEINDNRNMLTSTTYFYSTVQETTFAFDSETENHLGAIEVRNGNADESNDYENMQTSTTSYFYDTTLENVVTFDSSESGNHINSKEVTNGNTEESNGYENMPTSATSYFYGITRLNTLEFNSSENRFRVVEVGNDSEEINNYRKMPIASNSYFDDTTQKNIVALNSQNRLVSKDARNSNSEESNDYESMPTSTTYFYDTTTETTFAFDTIKSENHLRAVEVRNGNSKEINDYENMQISTTSYFYDTTHENAFTLGSNKNENDSAAIRARNSNAEKSSDYERIPTSTTLYFYDTAHENTFPFGSNESHNNSNSDRSSQFEFSTSISSSKPDELKNSTESAVYSYKDERLFTTNIFTKPSTLNLSRLNRNSSDLNSGFQLHKPNDNSSEQNLNGDIEFNFTATAFPILAAVRSTENNLTNNYFPLNVRWSGQDSNNFEGIKNAAKEFATVNEHLQTSQQSSVNQDFGRTPCPTFISPMGFPVLQQAGAFPYLYNPNQANPYANIMSFPIPRAQTNSYIAQQYPYAAGANLLPSYSKPMTQQNGYLMYNANGQNIIAPSPGGQYYICNPLPNLLGNSNTDGTPQVEIRKSADDINLNQQYFASENIENKTRASRNCPSGERSCEDDSKCIKTHHFCDGEVQCKDASDEAFCPCKFRIGRSRQCDGYFDCPNGEDELKCFGCEANMFSCDDWSPNDRIATCIPIEQRCDGIPQCPTGKDEHDCSILTEKLSEKQHFIVSTTVGFLYKNYKGRWYPACRNPEVWANEACQSAAGPNTMTPLTHLVPVDTNYNGPYVSVSLKEHTEVVHSCEVGAAVFVECPPLVCGMRKKTRNPYRRQEVDTSAEQILSQFERTKETSEAQNVTDNILGDGRVVGGKPSQPEAWPWIVSVYRNGVFHCGGVLINELWIVTACHCVEKYWHYYYEVQAGVLRRYSYAPMVQNRMVSHIIAHQLYDRTKLKNDLALMRMSNPVIFDRYVRPICLPSEITAGQNFKWGPEPGTVCTAVGWGATVEHGSDPDHLREVEVPVLKHCKHREDQEGREICAGLMEGGKDACQGDSGGPFMCRNPNAPNQWYLAGIVSHGEGCARPNEPGVYTRVSLFLEWIFENIRAEMLPQTRPLHHCPGYICHKTKRCIANKRHCNKIVDCLLGDDEMHCDRSDFNEIFKHAMRHMLLGSQLENNDTTSLPITELNEEAITVLTSTEFNNVYSTVTLENTSEVTETSTTVQTIMPSSIRSVNKKFVCKGMLQTIDISKQCDRIADCEDATDEDGCTCTSYLRNLHPEAICDGIADCLDMSDEKQCHICKQNEYHCRHSNTCISQEKKCNNVADCPRKEDELDCFALTDGENIMLDGDLRPYLNDSGLVSFNHNGTWRVVCGDWTGTEATLSADICFYLGFSDYKSFLKVPVYDNPLQVVYNSSNRAAHTLPVGNKCTALYIKCSDVIDIKHFTEYANISKSITNIQETPWNAEIYVNGEFKCTGAILDTNWIITSSGCLESDFKLKSKYVTVLLGGGKTYLDVMGPHEQVIRVTESIQVSNSDIILLRLGNSIKFSRYIRPIRFTVRDYTVSEREKCIALGRNFKNFTESVILQSVTNCTFGFRCFKRTEPVKEICQNKNFNSWSGCIVCQSKHGWYPAAVFQTSRGSCGFITTTAYTSVQYWRANILKLTKQAAFAVDAPLCKGFRCSLGNCIEDHKVCDGIPNCRDEGDEDPNQCAEKQKQCHISSACVCLKSELRCQNGKCIPKTAFCDKNNDCGDWSDEPESCTCKSYLTLTNPEKICDGIRNCQDRTDEDPNVCKCRGYHFRCGKSNECIPHDMVCDGVPDCRNGEDETQCIALVSTPGSPATEVQVRTAGVWHPGCFPNLLTTLQLEKICEKIGYLGGSAVRINPANLSKTAWRPVTDPFIGILIHHPPKRNLMIAVRSGNNPFVSLKADSNCYRLFLQCL